jgi:hypothetical protein
LQEKFRVEFDPIKPEGKFMKAVAILMAALLLLPSCSNQTTVKEAPGAIWQAQLLGGKGQESGFSFNTQFGFNGNGSLTFGNFQFINFDSGSSCFPFSGELPTGSLTNFNFDQTTLAVTATFAFTVESGGNSLTLTGPLVAVASETGQTGNNTITLTSGSVTGDWMFTGGGTPAGCSDTLTGSFTMTMSTT